MVSRAVLLGAILCGTAALFGVWWWLRLPEHSTQFASLDQMVTVIHHSRRGGSYRETVTKGQNIAEMFQMPLLFMPIVFLVIWKSLGRRSNGISML